MIEQMLHVTETAAKTTKRVRREMERRKHAGDAHPANRASPVPVPPETPKDANPHGFQSNRWNSTSTER